MRPQHPPHQPKPPHPLVHAGRWLIADLLSTFLLLALYAVSHSIAVATAVSIALGMAQIVWLRLKGRSIDAMQWVSLFLVAALGGSALLTHDPRFIMFKPTLVYVAIGAAMLKRGWMVRYMPPVAMEWAADVITQFGFAWAALMFATAAMNVAFVIHGDAKAWSLFLGVFPLGSKIVLFGLQYATTRMVVRRRRRLDQPRQTFAAAIPG